jgi:hypothetical protein
MATGLEFELGAGLLAKKGVDDIVAAQRETLNAFDPENDPELIARIKAAKRR